MIEVNINNQITTVIPKPDSNQITVATSVIGNPIAVVSRERQLVVVHPLQTVTVELELQQVYTQS